MLFASMFNASIAAVVGLINLIFDITASQHHSPLYLGIIKLVVYESS
jgi:hypothetical protein